jgi:hypothetical protein
MAIASGDEAHEEKDEDAASVVGAGQQRLGGGAEAMR